MQAREQFYPLYFLLIFTEKVSRHLCVMTIIQSEELLNSISKWPTEKSPLPQVHGTWWDTPQGAKRTDIMSPLSIMAEKPLQSREAPEDMKASLAHISWQSNRNDQGTAGQSDLLQTLGMSEQVLLERTSELTVQKVIRNRQQGFTKGK